MFEFPSLDANWTCSNALFSLARVSQSGFAGALHPFEALQPLLRAPGRPIHAELAALAPNTDLVEDARFTDNGQVLTSAGISAGLDVSLHIVARLLGDAAATQTARYMEYHWLNDAGVTR